MQIFFFFEQFQEELFRAEEDAPIDEPEIIARHIGPVIDKFDADPFLLTAALRFHLPGQNFLSNDVQVFQRLEKILAEYGLGAIIDGYRRGLHRRQLNGDSRNTINNIADNRIGIDLLGLALEIEQDAMA